jgi:hypothetical protein
MPRVTTRKTLHYQKNGTKRMMLIKGLFGEPTARGLKATTASRPLPER